MAIRVIDDHPRRTLARLGRGIVVLLGILFVTAGLVAAILPLLFLFVFVTGLISGAGTELSDEDTPLLLGSAGVAVVALYLGLRLVRGRRRMALFLRRFGPGPATAAVTAAVSSALGRSWRVVTLDDGDVEPLGVARTGRRLSRLGILVGVAIVAAALWWLLGGGLDRFVDGVVESTGSDTEDAAAEIVGSIVAVMVAFLVALVLVVVPAAFAGGLALFSFGSYLAGRRGERAKLAEMATVHDIGRVADAVSRSTHRTLAPRLVVVRVASAIWRRAVHELAGRAGIVVVDVSEPSENLVWEIEALRPSARPRWIFIAHRPQLAALTGARQAAGSPAARVLAAIDGCQVIAYDTHRSGIRRFTRALGGALATGG